MEKKINPKLSIVTTLFNSENYIDEFYSLKDRSKVEDPKFYDGEPIWVTAKNQGINTNAGMRITNHRNIMVGATRIR